MEAVAEIIPAMDLIRPMAIANHPLTNKDYTIPTPAIDAMVSMAMRCIEQRIPGAILEGINRSGKTTGIGYTIRTLKNEVPGAAVYRFSCTRDLTDNPNDFFSHLLYSFNHPDPFSGKCRQKRVRLTEMLMKDAGKGRRGLVVIFADEAQRLSYNMYAWLADIYNELDSKRVTVITFLVGQPDLANQKVALIKANRMEIVGRFMVQHLRFNGLTSASDVATCLNAYDESCCPEGSGWSYTRFFFPKAYLCGMRAVSSATTLWNVFQQHHEVAGSPGELEIPMQYFAGAVEHIFRTYSGDDNADFGVSERMWAGAVEETGFKALEENLRLRMTMSVQDD